MGRAVYLQRIAYGRSAYEHPEERTDSQAQSAGARQPESYRYREWIQQYNDRGHPVNLQSRARARAVRNSCNDVLSVIGLVERKDDAADSKTNTSSKPNASLVQAVEDEDAVGASLTLGGLYLHDVTCWWTAGMTNRLFVYGCSSARSFADIFITQRRSMGLANFMFAGLVPAFTAGTVLNPGWVWIASLIVNGIDRVILATVSSRALRKGYFDSIRPVVSACTEICCYAAVFPLRLHSLLQTLGLAPMNRLFPAWKQCIPFSPYSPLKIDGSTPLPIVLLFLYAPIATQFHQWLATSLLPIELDRLSDEELLDYMGGVPDDLPDAPLDSLPTPGGEEPPIEVEQDVADADVPQETPPLETPLEEPSTTPLDPPLVSIRISSYDPVSSSVNLEIGVPEELATQNSLLAPPQSTGVSDQADSSRRRQRRLDDPQTQPDSGSQEDPDEASSQAISTSPTRRPSEMRRYGISSLTTTSQETLLSIRNHALLTIALLPAKAFIVRGIAKHYTTHNLASPDTKFLVGLGDSTSLSTISSSVSTLVVGRVLLTCLADVAVGSVIAWVQCWLSKKIKLMYFSGKSEAVGEVQMDMEELD